MSGMEHTGGERKALVSAPSEIEPIVGTVTGEGGEKGGEGTVPLLTGREEGGRGGGLSVEGGIESISPTMRGTGSRMVYMVGYRGSGVSWWCTQLGEELGSRGWNVVEVGWDDVGSIRDDAVLVLVVRASSKLPHTPPPPLPRNPDLLLVTHGLSLFTPHTLTSLPPPSPFLSWRDLSTHQPLHAVLKAIGPELWNAALRAWEREGERGKDEDSGAGGGGGRGGEDDDDDDDDDVEEGDGAVEERRGRRRGEESGEERRGGGIGEDWWLRGDWRVVVVEQVGWECGLGHSLEASVPPCLHHLSSLLTTPQPPFHPPLPPTTHSLPPTLPFTLRHKDEISAAMPWLRDVMTGRGAALGSVPGCKKASWEHLEVLRPQTSPGEDPFVLRQLVSVVARCVYDDASIAVDGSYRFAIFHSGLQSATGEEIYVLIRPADAQRPNQVPSTSYKTSTTPRRLSKEPFPTTIIPNRTITFIIESEVREWTDSQPIVASEKAKALHDCASVLDLPCNPILQDEATNVYGTLPPLAFQLALALRQKKFCWTDTAVTFERDHTLETERFGSGTQVFIPSLLPLIAPQGIRFIVDGDFEKLTSGRRRQRLPAGVQEMEDKSARARALQRAAEAATSLLDRRPDSLTYHIFFYTDKAEKPYEIRWLLPLTIVPEHTSRFSVHAPAFHPGMPPSSAPQPRSTINAFLSCDVKQVSHEGLLRVVLQVRSLLSPEMAEKSVRVRGKCLKYEM